uniref:Uncharacterized protein n=1 Tax=Xenopus tropicalis TaxID=8364 RepID=A0A1B8Y9X6_XENTR
MNTRRGKSKCLRVNRPSSRRDLPHSIRGSATSNPHSHNSKHKPESSPCAQPAVIKAEVYV